MDDSMKFGIITNCKAGLELAQRLLERDHRIALCKIGDLIPNSEFVGFTHEISSYNADLVVDIETLVASVPQPRTIIILCKNYNSDLLSQISNVVSPGDTIVDCSDMFYKESARNTLALKKQGVTYIGTGYIYVTDQSIEKPAFMISGNEEVAKKIQYYLSDISASVAGKSCAAYLGPEGVGQFVKMVTTGIYFANLEIVSEAIEIMQRVLKMDPNEIANILSDFNSGEAQSYILDSASSVIGRIDDLTDGYLADAVLDRVQNSHKDGWIGRSSTELDCPIPTISAAIDMHFASQRINERVAASGICYAKPLDNVDSSKRKEITEHCRKAIYMGAICAAAQGYSMIKSASDRYMWNIDLAMVAACIQGGTMLQSNLMLKVFEILNNNPKIENLITSDYFTDVIRNYSDDVRELICECVRDGISIPGISSIINYIDSMRCRKLPCASAQLIRDSISGLGFERIDRSGLFTGEWQLPSNSVKQNKIKD